MRRFNYLADFSREEIKELIALAARLDTKPEPRALEGKVLSLLFLSPSLRTLSSFQAAMLRLGGGSFVISPDMSIHGLESRYGIVMDGAAAEHVREAIPVISETSPCCIAGMTFSVAIFATPMTPHLTLRKRLPSRWNRRPTASGGDS